MDVAWKINRNKELADLSLFPKPSREWTLRIRPTQLVEPTGWVRVTTHLFPECEGGE